MSLEIERKFKVTKLPDELSSFPWHFIEQVYLKEETDQDQSNRDDGDGAEKNVAPLRRLRLLRDASGQESYIYTEKGSGLRMRREEERSLSLAEYQALRKQVVGRSVCKVRYRIPLTGGYTAELDIYRDFLEGLVTVEVEFPSLAEAEAFQPPRWFGEDVTERPDFKNSALAQRAEPGFPD